ncbi:MAG: hypothetical protein WDN45_01325 [Caulobacteraceae bacterium]
MPALLATRSLVAASLAWPGLPAHAAQFSVTNGTTQTAPGPAYTATAAVNTGSALLATGSGSTINGSNLALSSTFTNAYGLFVDTGGTINLTGGTVTNSAGMSVVAGAGTETLTDVTVNNTSTSLGVYAVQANAGGSLNMIRGTVTALSGAGGRACGRGGKPDIASGDDHSHQRDQCFGHSQRPGEYRRHRGVGHDPRGYIRGGGSADAIGRESHRRGLHHVRDKFLRSVRQRRRRGAQFVRRRLLHRGSRPTRPDGLCWPTGSRPRPMPANM